MANKNGYTVTRSNYTIQKKHKTLDNGTVIYVRDYMTNNSSNYPSKVFSYGESNFRLATPENVEEKRVHETGKWIENSEGSVYWTKGDFSSTTESSESTIKLNPNYKSLRDFAYYGSCYEAVKNSINNIIKNYPGELYVTNESANYTVITSEDGEEYKTITVGGDFGDMVKIDNPFNIDITSLRRPKNTEDDNDLRYFCDSSQNYVFVTDNVVAKSKTSEEEEKVLAPDWLIIEKNEPCYGGDMMAKVLMSLTYNPEKGDDSASEPFYIYQFYKDGDFFLACDKKYAGTHIRPQNTCLKEFFDNQTDLEKLLLNRDTNPKFTMTIEYPYEDVNTGEFMIGTRSYTWPRRNDWNISIGGNNFEKYFLHPILTIAEFYDKYFTNNIWKNLVHDSLKNMDLTYTNDGKNEDKTDFELGQTRFESLMYSYGYFFDQLKRYTDNIKYTNTVTYDSNNNTPDYFLSDANEISGWEITSAVNGINDDTETSNLDGLYNTETTVYDKNNTNVEFEKRLKLNSKEIFLRKGTREGIEMILALFGFESYDFARNKYNRLDPSEKYTVSGIRYNNFDDLPTDEKYKLFDYKIDEYVCVAEPRNTKNPDRIYTQTDYIFTLSNGIIVVLDKLNTEYFLKDCISGYTDSNQYFDNIETIKVKGIECDGEYFIEIVSGGAYEVSTGRYVNMGYIEFFTKNITLMPNEKNTNQDNGYQYVGSDSDVESDPEKFSYLKLNGNKLNDVTELLLKGEKIEDSTTYSEKERYIFNYADDMPLEIFNTFKKSYDNNAYDDKLQGLPVEYVRLPIDGYLYKYIIPWFNQGNTYDGGMYFQMNGGWGKISNKSIKSELSELTEITSTDETPFYLESVKYLKVVSRPYDLTLLDYDSLKNKTLVKCMLNVESMKLEIENTFDYTFNDEETATTEFSQYFYIENKENYEHYGEFTDDDGTEQVGWVNVPPIDIESGVSLGLKVLYMESIIDSSKGNAPHTGYGQYDDGKEYIEYFDKLFKYSLENDNFNNNAYDCSNENLIPEIEEQGFDNLITASGTVNYIKDNQKCWYFNNIKHRDNSTTAKVPYLINYVNDYPNVYTKLEHEESELGEIVHSIGALSSRNLESDLLPFDFEGVTSTDDIEYGTDINCANSIINTKKLRIEFLSKKTSLGISEYDSQLRVHLEQSVIPYLTQIIPSTCIFEIVLPEVEDAVDLEIADAGGMTDDTVVLNNKYVEEE